MIKYVCLAATVLLVFCMISDTTARSATGTAYQQHANSITVEQTKAEHASSGASSTAPSPIWKDFSLVYRIYQQCANENLSVCLKVKLLTGLERALRASKILKIIEGVQFVQNDESSAASEAAKLAGGKVINSEKDIEAVLPRGLDAKEHVLNNMIFKRLAGFLQDHTLQVKFPDLHGANQYASNTVEGRKKKDKKGGGGAYIMIPLLLGGTFVPIAYGALAMLAGKALIVSKLALVLASIIGIKKLLSGGGKDASHEVVVSSGGHSGWGRDFDLAYNGWKPGKETAKSL